MARSTMTINTRFSPRVDPFCGEDSLTVFSNVVPEREKKKKNIHLIFFWEANADSVQWTLAKKKGTKKYVNNQVK